MGAEPFADAHLCAALDAANVGVWSWDLAHFSYDWRPPARDALFAMGFDGSLSSLRRAAFPEDFDRALGDMERARVLRSPFAIFLHVADPGRASRRLVVNGSFAYDANGDAHAMTAAIRDAGDGDMEASHEELRALNARLRTAREDEAARIARELHDGMGQALTALTLDITWLRERVAEDARLHLDDMAELVKSTLASMRRIVAELRPTVLEDLGLVPALEWLVEDFKSRNALDVRAALGASGRGFAFGRETSIAFFRVLQEALTNVTRHAAAKRIDVSFSHDGEHAILTIHDDGRGFSLPEVRARGALGLCGMRERMETIGGELHVDVSRGQGTRILARAPVDEPA